MLVLYDPQLFFDVGRDTIYDKFTQRGSELPDGLFTSPGKDYELTDQWIVIRRYGSSLHEISVEPDGRTAGHM